MAREHVGGGWRSPVTIGEAMIKVEGLLRKDKSFPSVSDKQRKESFNADKPGLIRMSLQDPPSVNNLDSQGWL